VLDLWLNLARMSATSEAVAGYLNLQTKELLQQVTEYLRKELKVP